MQLLRLLEYANFKDEQLYALKTLFILYKSIIFTYKRYFGANLG